MEIIAISISVHYDDILQHVLDQNSRFLKKWIIVTAPEDEKTISLIKNSGKENIHLLLYPDFYSTRNKFNKGGAVKFAQDFIDANFTSANILLLDSDIYLPDNFREQLPKSLEEHTLYGVSERLDYWTLEDFNNNTNPHKYGTASHFLFVGYFQLYKQSKRYKYRNSYNCSECDDLFRNKFPNRIVLDMTVKHLGQEKVNWNGRSSKSNF